MFNRDLYIKELSNLTIDALKALVINIRAEVNSGLLSSKEAHDRINAISVVLMTKEIEGMASQKLA